MSEEPVVEQDVDATPETVPSDSGNWRDTITDDSLRSVAERFNTPADAIKSVADLRKQLSTSIRVPGENASPEEVQKFYKALGVPDSPEGYKFEMPEGRQVTDADKAFQATMAQAFHAAGISGAAASKLNQAWNSMQSQAEQAMLEADKKFTEESESRLRQEWGADFDRNKELAGRAAQNLFDNFEDARKIEMKDGRFLLDHPVIVKMLAKVGGEMAEDGFRRLDQNDIATLEQQANDLGRQKMDAYQKGDINLAKKLDEQQRNILGKLTK